MPQIQFRESTAADARYIAARLRAADLREVQLLSSDSTAKVVEASRDYSNWSRVFDIDGEAAVIFGVTPSHKEGWGVPWLLATDAAMPVARRLVRDCRPQVEEMHMTFPCLHNLVHGENHVSIQWLRWLGFTIGTVPCGPSEQFFLFWKKG